MKPVRKIGISAYSLRAIQPSEKNKRAIHTESSLERDACCLLEFNQEVEEYIEQPITIRYTEAGKVRRYTPDFFVRYASGRPPLLLEIKYMADIEANQALFAARFLAAWQYAEAQGWEFDIWTEREIRTPFLRNVKFLLRFLSLTVVIRTEQRYLLLKLIAWLEDTTPAEVLTAACEDPQKQAELLPILWHLVGTNQVGCDLLKPLTMHSPLWNICT